MTSYISRLQYEFERVGLYHDEETRDMLEKRGKDSWELVAVTATDENYANFYFKRVVYGYLDMGPK